MKQQYTKRYTSKNKGPAILRDCRAEKSEAEDEGLEPPRACARRISSAVPYQLDYASRSDISRDGRI